MTVSSPDINTTTDQDFAQNSFLTYIIPSATNYDINDALETYNGLPTAFFEGIEERDWLFFDETVDVYLVLRTPYLEKENLSSFLGRLAIYLEAQVVNSNAHDRDGPPAQEVVYSGTLDDPSRPLATTHDVVGAEDDEGERRQTYVVWKLPVFLGRPRMRLQNPTAGVAATATLRPATDSSVLRKNDYLHSRTPVGLNLLEAFGNDPALNGVKPRLSAQRVSRVAPVTQTKDQLRPIRGLKSLTLKIYPAVHTRVRFARPSTVPTNPGIIALLEVDFTPFFECEAVLTKISLDVPSAQITDLNKFQGLALPLSCVAHDHVTFMYKFAPLEQDVDIIRSPTREVAVAVDVTVLLKPGVCTPRLSMAWAATLDFTLPVNPGFGTAMTNASLQRAHRPSQLSIDGASSLVAPAISRPDALPSLEAAASRTAETTIPAFGITMTFTAPQGPVYAGDEFHWTVFVTNRAASSSSAAAAGPPRKLALIAIPRRRRNDVRVMRPPSTSGSGKGAKSAGPGTEQQQQPPQPVADAVLDENIVHAMQRSSLVDTTEVVCLSADTRVGPLAPNACYVVELRFVALREGIVGVEAIRVVDLGSQEHVDVRELPVMKIEKPPTC